MKVRTSSRQGRGARFAAVTSLAGVLVAAGVALAAPAAAAGTACPPASKPPVVNNWYGADGRVYGTTITGFSSPNPGYVANNQQLTTYRTDFTDGSSRTETWRGIPGYQTRVSCSERPATNRTGEFRERSGGGGGSLGAGAWSSGGGVTVGTVTVRPIQHF